MAYPNDIYDEDEENYGQPAPSDSLTNGTARELEDDRLLDDGPGNGLANTGTAYPPVNHVKEMIASKMGLAPQTQAPPPSAEPASSPQPSLEDLLSQEQEMSDAARQQKGESDRITNFGQALGGFARGASAPEDSSKFYDSINKQNQEQMTSVNSDLDRRRRILTAIANNTTKKDIKTAGIDSKATDQDLRQQEIDARAKKAAQPTGSSPADARTALRRIQFASGVEKEIRNDSIAKIAETNLQSLNKARDTINNTKLPLTMQTLSDVEQDAASGMSFRPGGTTEGKIQRTEYKNYQTLLAGLKQKYGDKPVDLRKEAPEVVKQVSKFVNSLGNGYLDTIAERHNRILNGKLAVTKSDKDLTESLTDLGKALSSERDVYKNKFKEIKAKAYNPARNQTRLTYDDDTSEVVDGQR